MFGASACQPSMVWEGDWLHPTRVIGSSAKIGTLAM